MSTNTEQPEKESVQAITSSHAGLELAIHGGRPVRSTPLPWEFPGAGWIDERELELVTSVVKAKSPFRFYGPDSQHMVHRFESQWREQFGHTHALAVSSGTAALSIAIAALDIGPGQEVLVPGYLWVSCVSAVVRAGAIPRLVDIDDTFCMDPEDLARKIGERSAAVLFVHMSGAPGRIDAVAAICRDRGLFLIEDCAQAAGASAHGTAVGRFGDLGIFSFQLNKNMTSGEGGMIVSRTPELYRRTVALHDLGYPRTTAGRLDTESPDMQLWGMGARMPELTAAMALAQLEKLPAITQAMRQAKWAIRQAMEGTPGLTFRHVSDPAGDSGPFLLMLLPDGDIARRWVDALKAEGIHGPEGSLACITLQDWGMHWHFNIPSLVHKRSNSRDGMPWSHPANAFAQAYRYDRGVLPRCEDYMHRGALLTIGSTLTDQDVDDIIAAMRKVARVLLG